MDTTSQCAADVGTGAKTDVEADAGAAVDVNVEADVEALPAPLRAALAAALDELPDEARRLFHGRGHLHPGLEHVNVDWYPPVLLVTLHGPLGEDEMAALLALVRSGDRLRQVAGVCVQRRDLRGAPAEWPLGEAVATCVVSEDGLRFEVAAGARQNPGLFLDSRLLRQWLRSEAAGQRVLNLFAYTCSLSVAAVAGGAARVVNVDMARSMLDWGRRNHRLNGLDSRRASYLPMNVFKAWPRIRRYAPFDILIADPPTRQHGSFDAERDYPKLLRRLASLAAPQARLVVTANSPWLGADFLQGQVARHLPGYRMERQIPASAEFADRYPERALIMLVFRRQSQR